MSTFVQKTVHVNQNGIQPKELKSLERHSNLKEAFLKSCPRFKPCLQAPYCCLSITQNNKEPTKIHIQVNGKKHLYLLTRDRISLLHETLTKVQNSQAAKQIYTTRSTDINKLDQGLSQKTTDKHNYFHTCSQLESRIFTEYLSKKKIYLEISNLEQFKMKKSGPC